MNTADHKWEADIRQKVEQHEFEFDPKAWEALDKLLDASSSTASKPASNNNWLSSGWKLLLLLLALALLLYWLSRWQNTEVPLLSSFPTQETLSEIQPANITTAPLEDIEESSQSVIQTQQQRPSNPITTPTAIEITEAQPTTELTPITTSEPRPEPMIVAPLESSQEIPLLNRQAFPIELKIQLPKKRRRRRNRGTLFPDVIPKY